MTSSLFLKRFGKVLWLCLWVWLASYLAWPLLVPISPQNNPHAIDFRMRYNEATCVRQGRDPFLVWNGTLPKGEYTPWNFALVMSADKAQLLHAYPPWEYVWMLPMTLLPLPIAEYTFRALNWGGLLLLIVGAYRLGSRQKDGAPWAGFAAISAVLLANNAIDACLAYQNYGILITVAVFCAMACHRSGRELLAGLFWSFTLVKPQIGALFFVPLLLRRKWATLFVAGGVTLFGTLLSAFLCGRPPLDMVLSITQYSRGQFSETGIIPHSLFSFLLPIWGDSGLMLASASIGILLCVVLSLILLPSCDEYEWVVPPAFLATLWAASRTHDQAIYAIMFLSLALSALRRCKPWPLLLDIFLIIFTLLRGIDDTLPYYVNVFQLIAFVLFLVRSVQIRKGV